MEYIAAFVVVNNNSTTVIDFLTKWIEYMNLLRISKAIPGHETPSMCVQIENFRNILKIGDLNERVVGCVNNYHKGETKIIHMKSGDGVRQISDRINAVKNYDINKIKQYQYK